MWDLGLARIVPDGQRLIRAPAVADVVDDDVVPTCNAQRFAAAARAGCRTGAYSDIPNDDVVGIDHQHVILNGAFEGDTTARRGLAGDGDIRVVNLQGATQRNIAGNAEDHRSRPGTIDAASQAAAAAVIQIGDLTNGATAPPDSHRSFTFGSRKGDDGAK